MGSDLSDASEVRAESDEQWCVTNGPDGAESRELPPDLTPGEAVDGADVVVSRENRGVGARCRQGVGDKRRRRPSVGPTNCTCGATQRTKSRDRAVFAMGNEYQLLGDGQWELRSKPD